MTESLISSSVSLTSLAEEFNRITCGYVLFDVPHVVSLTSLPEEFGSVIRPHTLQLVSSDIVLIYLFIYLDR